MEHDFETILYTLANIKHFVTYASFGEGTGNLGRSRDSVVGVATGYELDDRGLEFESR
jgi:hypothetical protein